MDDIFKIDFESNGIVTQVKNYNTLPWIEKYRPSTLDDILYHDQIRASLKTFIEKKCLPHLLFYGPPGTGKTSTIMACAKELYGNYISTMMLELNASDDRGIEVVRTKIKEFVTAQSVLCSDEKKNIFKMVILDETDAMTSDAQAILRKVVEQYTLTTRFCLICNYIQNIDPALQSRCTRFRFAPLDKPNMIKKIKQVASLENLNINNTGINTLIKRSSGDVRKILNILQSTSMSHNIINEVNINLCLGYPRKNQIDDIINNLININNFKESYDNILVIKKNNELSLIDIIEEVHNYLSELIIKNNTTNLTINMIVYILDKIRNIKYNQAYNTSDTIQISSLIAIFIKAKKLNIS